MVTLVDSARWAPLIGRLILAFGSIEKTTHECIRAWTGEQIHKHFAHARLNARIELARDLAQSSNASNQTKHAFSESLTKAKNLAKHRNLVAHNPLCLVIFQNDLDPSFIEAIASSTDDNKHLSFKDLAKIVDCAEQCAEELLRNFIAFRLDNLDIESLKRFPGIGTNNGA